MLKRPERVWTLEEPYRDAYVGYCNAGAATAKESKLAVLAIARNAMPHLPNTLGLLDELFPMFGSSVMYVYENDSTDDTAAVLDEFAATRPNVVVEHETLGEPDTRGFQPDRTTRLARCRNRCLDWLATSDADYALVLDVDPHGGFSPDGILNSVAWLQENPGAGGMASFSLFFRRGEGDDIEVAHYDAWAMRLNWWEDRKRINSGMVWAHSLMPPVGSPPIPMNSAFGGACLYRTKALLSARYSGIGVDGQPDCEHVALHHQMRQAGWQLYLNPGSLYVAILP